MTESATPGAALAAYPDRISGDSWRVARAVAPLTIGFWLFNFTLLTLKNVIDAEPDWQLRAMARLIAICVGLGFCFVIHLVLRAMRGWSFGWRAMLALVLSIAAGDGLALFTGTLLEQMQGLPLSGFGTFTGAELYLVAYNVWFFLAWSAMYMALSYNEEVRAQERRWAELRDLAHATQLRALSYQVQPHFLFNTLNSIATLVLDRRVKDAHAMITRLADFLRASLAIDPLANISLGDEVALQRLYLGIEQVRFPDLMTRIEIPQDLNRAEVPSMILQPLVENAIKYAVAGCDRPATIALKAAADSDRLVLEVVDDGCASANGSPGSSGIGLKNVRERLRAMFGDAQSFDAGPIEPSGFRVRLTMPLRVTP